jgi:hypothetical protein
MEEVPTQFDYLRIRVSKKDAWADAERFKRLVGGARTVEVLEKE